MSSLSLESTPTPPESDPRPRFAIGHVGLIASDVDRLAQFYEQIGMRLIVNMGSMAILELRGGTHLVVQAGTPTAGASLDLMVDDIDDTHAVLVAAGAEPSSIVRGSPHDRFVATDPEGTTLHLNSNHAMGPV